MSHNLTPFCRVVVFIQFFGPKKTCAVRGVLAILWLCLEFCSKDILLVVTDLTPLTAALYTTTPTKKRRLDDFFYKLTKLFLVSRTPSQFSSHQRRKTWKKNNFIFDPFLPSLANFFLLIFSFCTFELLKRFLLRYMKIGKTILMNQKELDTHSNA